MITLHGWHGQGGGDSGNGLNMADLAVLWGILRAENLVEVFFHDGCVRDLAGFLRFATDRGNWFYAARQHGVWLGLGVVNPFSSSGNTAYGHLVSFEAGRKSPADGGRAAEEGAGESHAGDSEYIAGRGFRPSLNGPFAEAGKLWFELLRGKGGLETLIAVIPGCYRGVRQWAEAFGFMQQMRLPGALRLCRPGGKTRQADACVYQLTL